MEKVNLTTNNVDKYAIATTAPTDCSCYECGSCLLCIIFAPAVGIALGVAVGRAVVSQRKE